MYASSPNWVLGCLLFSILNDSVIVANDDRQCGPYALRAVLNGLGETVTFTDVIKDLPNEGRDSSLAELADVAASRYNLKALGLHWADDPPTGAPPGIIGVASNDRLLHFVAVLAWSADGAVVQDRDLIREVGISQLRQGGWNGDCVHFARFDTDFGSIRPPWWQSDNVCWTLASIALFAASACWLVPVSWLRSLCQTA
jgi:hypothetical protein